MIRLKKSSRKSPTILLLSSTVKHSSALAGFRPKVEVTTIIAIVHANCSRNGIPPILYMPLQSPSNILVEAPFVLGLFLGRFELVLFGMLIVFSPYYLSNLLYMIGMPHGAKGTIFPTIGNLVRERTPQQDQKIK